MAKCFISFFFQGNEKKIYEYVVRHFLACVSQDAQGHETVVEIEIAQEKVNFNKCFLYNSAFFILVYIFRCIDWNFDSLEKQKNNTK